MADEDAKTPPRAEALRTILEGQRVLGELAEARLREFFESSPLYRRATLHLGKPTQHLTFPRALSMPCDDPACRKEPTTTWQLQEGLSAMFDPGHLLAYMCVHCDKAKKTFWVVTFPSDPAYKALPGNPQGPLMGFRTYTVFKIGQYPSWSITPAKAVQRALSPGDLELYKNGLVCMSQAYGIGALGYFRRVVENAVADLLTLVEEAARTEDDAKALAAVEAARATKVADEKLKLVAAVVPASLRPGGVNPLATLHDDYSRGLHALSDEECLEVATEMRDALDYVFGNLRDQLDQAKAYRDKITKRATRPR